MDTKQAIEVAEKFAELVKKEFDPLQIYLFGSYSKGTQREYSDIDIAVIYDKYTGPGDLWDAATRLSALCREANPPADVDAYIEPHLLELSDDPMGFVREVKKTGKLLYSKV